MVLGETFEGGAEVVVHLLDEEASFGFGLISVGVLDDVDALEVGDGAVGAVVVALWGVWLLDSYLKMI